MKAPDISLDDIERHERSTLSTHGKKSRKSISLRPELFVRFKRAAQTRGIPLARLLDIVLTNFLNANRCPQVTRDDALVDLKLALPKKGRRT